MAPRARRRRDAALAAAVAGLLAAGPASAQEPLPVDDGDTVRTATVLDPIGSMPITAAAVDGPGDHDFYSVRGAVRDARIRNVTFSIAARPPGCSAARPLRVALHNPEGRWMRTIGVAPGGVRSIPNLRGRYFIDVTPAQPACAGLRYDLGVSEIRDPALPDTPCRNRRIDRVFAEDWLKSLRRRVKLVSPEAVPRYVSYIDQARRQRDEAREAERRACGAVGSSIVDA